MCYKYINPHGTVFVWCEIANSKVGGASYLRCFRNGIDDYESNYQYCPYCGKKLEVKVFNRD